MHIPQTGDTAPTPSSEAPALPPGVVDVVTTDPAEFEVALRPWDLLCRPTEAGTFTHQVSLFAGTELLLYRESYDLGIQLTGLTPPGMLVLGVPILSGGETRYWGETASDLSLPCATPGPAEATLAAGYGQLVVGLPLERIRESTSPVVRERLGRLCPSHRVRCTAFARSRLGHWIDSSLAELKARPDLAREPAYESMLVEDFLSMLVDLVDDAVEAPEPRPSGSTRNGFHRALEYIREAPLQDVRLSHLCAVSGISERSLQYAFRDTLGVTPKAFITTRRLHAARRALLESDPSATRVADVAMRLGFYELGRFAGYYRKRFGEHPSTTLRRVR